MNILHISYKSKDEGAAIGAQRLFYAQRRFLSSVDFFVISDFYEKKYNIMFKTFLRLQNYIDKFLRKNKSRYVSSELLTLNWLKYVQLENYDIIHLHWLHRGLINCKILKKLLDYNLKIYLSMHDFRYITGGCHIPYECDRFKNGCYHCPQVISSFLTKKNKASRDLILQNPKINFFCTSTWLKKQVRKIPFIDTNRIHVVPNPIDTDIYKNKFYPSDSNYTKIGFLFSKDIRKGFNDVLAVIDKLKHNNRFKFYGIGEETNINIESVVSVGWIDTHDKLVNYLNEVDVMLLPAVDEPFGQIVAESVCCGTPVVCYRGFGPDSIIEHQITGYLAKQHCISDLVSGILYCRNLNIISNQRIRSYLSLQNVAKLSEKAYIN